MARVGCMKVSQLKSRVQKLFRSNKYHHIYTQSMHVCSVAFICKANTGNTGEMLQNLMNYLTGKTNYLHNIEFTAFQINPSRFPITLQRFS